MNCARTFLLPVLILLLASCSTPHFPIEKTKALKTDSLALMDKASEDRSTHATAISELQTRLDEARTYEAGIKGNADATALWDRLIDPTGGLLGGFLSQWQTRQRVSSAFIPEKKTQVSKAFDQILDATGKAN